MNRDNDAIERLKALNLESDTAFAEVHRRQTSQMQCRPGCSDCCRARLSVTRVEEALLREGLASFSSARRTELSDRTRDANREMCPALDDDGRCGVYAFRPLICRTFGAPLRHRRAVEMVNPPIVDSCDLNFTGHTSLKVLPPEDVLDQTSYIEALDVIDDDHCATNALPRGERIPLATILE